GRLPLRGARGLRRSALAEAPLHRAPVRGRLDQLVGPEHGGREGDVAERRFRDRDATRRRSVRLPPREEALRLIEAVMLWNEPNNLSHWDFQIDTDWKLFAEMTKLSCSALKAERPTLCRVLGGISPIDPNFMLNMKSQGVL